MNFVLLTALLLSQNINDANGELGALFQGKAQPFVAPGRLFSVQIPGHWGVALHDNDPYTIDFRLPSNFGGALLQIRRIVVPPRARPRQLLLNALDLRLRKLPNFKEHNRRNVQIAGRKGSALLGTYTYQGNIQYPRALEEVYLVAGEEAFIFHFECFEPEAARFATDLNRFYQSFVPRPVGGTAGPFDGAAEASPAPANPFVVPAKEKASIGEAKKP